jgi:hypothetical protein
MIGRAEDLSLVSQFGPEDFVSTCKGGKACVRFHFSADVMGWHVSNYGGVDRIRRKYASVFEANLVNVVPDLQAHMRKVSHIRKTCRPRHAAARHS